MVQQVRKPPTGRFLELAALISALSTAVYVDGGTDIPDEAQNGSEVAPFSTVQAAVDSLEAQGLTGALVLIAPGTYTEAVSVTRFVRLQGLALDQQVGSAVTITSVTKVGTSALDITGITVTTLTTLVSGGGVGVYQSTVGTLAAPLSVISGRGSTFGTFSALSIFTNDNCVHTGAISLASTTATSTFTNGCSFAAAADITGGGGSCTVQMDADSMFSYKNASNTFTSVTNIVVRTSMARASISVTVPVLAAGVVGAAAAVSTVGTELAGLGTGACISVTEPSAGITGGGALAGWRINAGNSVILKFVGPCTGGAQNFVMAKLTSGT